MHSYSNRRKVKRNKNHFDAKSDMTHTECSESDDIDHPHENVVTCGLHEATYLQERTQLVQPAQLKSPSRRKRRKAQKEYFRALIGMDKEMTQGTAEVEKRRAIGEEVKGLASNLHYFWFSRFWISIYATLLFSVISRKAIFLYGILIVVLLHILELAFVWVKFVSENREATANLQHVIWMSKVALTSLEKASEGDRLHGFLATKIFNFWSGTGMNAVLSFLRKQSHDITTQALKETKATLDNQSKLRLKFQKLHESRLTLEHQIKARLNRKKK